MDLSTYNGLLDSVLETLERPELTSAAPGWVTLAEAQMGRRLRVRDMIGRSSADVATEFFDLPTDFLSERTMVATVNGYRRDLDFVTLDVMDQACDEPPRAPRVWGVVGTQGRLHPRPDASYVLAMTYYAKIPALSDSNQTNWLLASHPDVYFYGTLLQSAPYLREDSRVGVWGDLFTAAISDIQSVGEDKRGRNLRVDPGLRARRPTFDIRRG